MVERSSTWVRGSYLERGHIRGTVPGGNTTWVWAVEGAQWRQLCGGVGQGTLGGPRHSSLCQSGVLSGGIPRGTQARAWQVYLHHWGSLRREVGQRSQEWARKDYLLQW